MIVSLREIGSVTKIIKTIVMARISIKVERKVSHSGPTYHFHQKQSYQSQQSDLPANGKERKSFFFHKVEYCFLFCKDEEKTSDFPIVPTTNQIHLSSSIKTLTSSSGNDLIKQFVFSAIFLATHLLRHGYFCSVK